MDQAILGRFRKCVEEIVQETIEPVTGDTRLSRLALDSLDMQELVYRLAEEFQLRIPNNVEFTYRMTVKEALSVIGLAS